MEFTTTESAEAAIPLRLPTKTYVVYMADPGTIYCQQGG